VVESGLQPQAGARLAAIAARLGFRLHQMGLPVTPERSRSFATCVALAEPNELPQLYWLGRVTLLTSNDQVQIYDQVFKEVFRGIVELGEIAGSADQEQLTTTPPSSGSDELAPGDRDQHTDGLGSAPQTNQTPQDQADELHEQASVLAAVSQRERLNDREFSTLTEAELAIIRHLVERLPVVPPLRTARRTRRDRSGSHLDIRSTLRRSHRTAGDPVILARRSRTTRPRRVLLVADVSGSMEPYARVYLHLMRGAVIALKAEAFVFATHLTRLTRALQIADADSAYRKVAHEAQDWAGGTRIGESLKDFLDQHGRRGLARGAVVVIVSDGWELGDTSALRQSMERLARLAHHVIWVNPRKAATDYQPLVGGMAAALPHVDTFVSGHSVRALQDVLTAITAARHRTERTAHHPRVA
jgi:uncharacterized protein with von Willebrand factor type A (vWA) domain